MMKTIFNIFVVCACVSFVQLQTAEWQMLELQWLQEGAQDGNSLGVLPRQSPIDGVEDAIGEEADLSDLFSNDSIGKLIERASLRLQSSGRMVEPFVEMQSAMPSLPGEDPLLQSSAEDAYAMQQQMAIMAASVGESEPSIVAKKPSPLIEAMYKERLVEEESEDSVVEEESEDSVSDEDYVLTREATCKKRKARTRIKKEKIKKDTKYADESDEEEIAYSIRNFSDVKQKELARLYDLKPKEFLRLLQKSGLLTEENTEEVWKRRRRWYQLSKGSKNSRERKNEKLIQAETLNTQLAKIKEALQKRLGEAGLDANVSHLTQPCEGGDNASTPKRKRKTPVCFSPEEQARREKFVKLTAQEARDLGEQAVNERHKEQIRLAWQARRDRKEDKIRQTNILKMQIAILKERLVAAGIEASASLRVSDVLDDEIRAVGVPHVAKPCEGVTDTMQQ